MERQALKLHARDMTLSRRRREPNRLGPVSTATHLRVQWASLSIDGYVSARSDPFTPPSQPRHLSNRNISPNEQRAPVVATDPHRLEKQNPTYVLGYRKENRAVPTDLQASSRLLSKCSNEVQGGDHSLIERPSTYLQTKAKALASGPKSKFTSKSVNPFTILRSTPETVSIDDEEVAFTVSADPGNHARSNFTVPTPPVFAQDQTT